MWINTNNSDSTEFKWFDIPEDFDFSEMKISLQLMSTNQVEFDLNKAFFYLAETRKDFSKFFEEHKDIDFIETPFWSLDVTFETLIKIWNNEKKLVGTFFNEIPVVYDYKKYINATDASIDNTKNKVSDVIYNEKEDWLHIEWWPVNIEDIIKNVKPWKDWKISIQSIDSLILD